MSLAQAIILSPSDNAAVTNGRIEAGQPFPGAAMAEMAIDPGRKTKSEELGYGDNEFVR